MTLAEANRCIALLEARNAELEEKVRHAETAEEAAYQEGRKAAEAEVARAINLFHALFTLVDGMLEGSERFPELEAPRLRKQVDVWIRGNTPLARRLPVSQ